MKYVPIVILPGWLLGSHRFLPLEEELKKYGFQVCIVDFPGFEQGKEIFRPWTLSDYVNYLGKYLEENEIIPAVFIGHSFGGRVALKFISENPTAARALILTGTPGYKAISNRRQKTVGAISMAGKALAANLQLPYFREISQKIFNSAVGARDLSKLSGFIRQTLINIVEEDLEPYMKKITIPTLLLWGSKDGIVPVDIAMKMKNTIADSELVVVPHVYHNMPYKSPQVFVEKLRAFLQKTTQ